MATVGWSQCLRLDKMKIAEMLDKNVNNGILRCMMTFNEDRIIERNQTRPTSLPF